MEITGTKKKIGRTRQIRKRITLLSGGFWQSSGGLVGKKRLENERKVAHGFLREKVLGR